MFYLTVYIFSICLLQVCNLSFSFVSMKCLKKKLKRIIFFSFQWYFFCLMALYCVCVVPKQYTVSLLPCSVYDLLVVFCVSCTVKTLYKCPSPLLSSGTNALFNMFFCFKTKKVEVEEAGSEGRDCKARTPQQPLNPPHNPLGF